MSAILFWFLLAFGVGTLGPNTSTSTASATDSAFPSTGVVTFDDGMPPPPPPPPGPKQQ